MFFTADAGLSLPSGWYLRGVASMSDDGTVLVGAAENDSLGQIAGFVLTGYTPVPEPTIIGCALAASTGLLLRRRPKQVQA